MGFGNGGANGGAVGAVGMNGGFQNMDGGANMAGYRMLQEFEFEIGRLREENAQLRYQKELNERDFESVMFENNTLYGKLENLENVFIGSAIQREGISSSSNSKLSQDYTTSTLMLENTELKKKVARLEEEKLELKQQIININNGNGGLGPASAMMNGGLADMNEVY